MSVGLFTQTLALNDQDVGIADVTETVYIERLDTNGPKLMLTINDTYKLYQDNLKVTNGMVISLGLGDAEGRSKALFKDSFVIGSVIPKGDQIVIEALQDDVWKTKQLEPKTIAYIDKTPSQILREVFPRLKLSIDAGNELKWSYYLNAGSTKSVMLEKMAADYGAVLWVARGTVYFRKKLGLINQAIAYEFDYAQNKGENPLIHSYTKYNPQSAKLRANCRNYWTWNQTKGYELLAGGYPPCYLPSIHKSQLDYRNYVSVPILDCVMAGFGKLEPSMLIKLNLNRMIKDESFDESVPNKQLVLGTRHYQKGSSYLTVCEMGTMIDAS